MISEIQNEDLKTFIYNYARKDKSFELALKAHFISRITIADQDDKYRSILSEVVKPKTLSHPKLGPTEKKTISVILHDFTHQMSDLLSMEDYTEAYYIIKHSLDKIAYIQNKFLVKDKPIEESRLTFLKGLSIILREPIAPGFRKNAERQLMEILHKSYYLPKNICITTVLDDADVLTYEDKAQLIDDLKVKSSWTHDKKALMKAVVRLSHPFQDLIATVLQDYEHKAIDEALKDLILHYPDKRPVVKSYLDEAMSDFSQGKTLLLCLEALSAKDHDKLSNLILDLQPESDLAVLNELSLHLTSAYLDSELDRLKAWMANLPAHVQARWYAKITDPTLLIGLIQSRKDLEWIKAYDTFLIRKGHAHVVKQLYLTYLNEFLAHHMGKNARDHVHKIEQRLLAIDQKDMLFVIKEDLLDTYGDRLNFALF